MSKILIIDDDDSVREELSERIRAMGLESEEADSLNAALKMLDEYVFDCVLLDLCIPIKFEGIARLEHGKHLLQRILSEYGAPPVIIITAHSGSGHTRAVEMMEIGAKSFVSKPFDKNPIEPKIAMVLSKNAGKHPALVFQTKFKEGVLGRVHTKCLHIQKDCDRVKRWKLQRNNTAELKTVCRAKEGT